MNVVVWDVAELWMKKTLTMSFAVTCLGLLLMGHFALNLRLLCLNLSACVISEPM